MSQRRTSSRCFIGCFSCAGWLILTVLFGVFNSPANLEDISDAEFEAILETAMLNAALVILGIAGAVIGGRFLIRYLVKRSKKSEFIVKNRLSARGELRSWETQIVNEQDPNQRIQIVEELAQNGDLETLQFFREFINFEVDPVVRDAIWDAIKVLEEILKSP